MTEGRIEGESPQQTTFLPEEETRKVPVTGAFSKDEVHSANEIIRGEQEKGQEVEGAVLVKAKVKGIKERNPIIVVMLIMQVVSNTLKESSDHTKEATKLTKREWKAFTLKQSENFHKGKENMEGTKAQGFQYGALACKFAPSILNQIHTRYGIMQNFDYDAISSWTGTGSSMLQNLGQVHQQTTGIEIQGHEALFQHEVGARSMDHQRMSQDNGEQSKSSADEKIPQLLSIASRMMTERA